MAARLYREFPAARAGRSNMFGALASTVAMAQRVARLADSIRLPRRRRRPRGDERPVGPKLVRGRGFGRRQRRPLVHVLLAALVYLLLVAGLVALW
jgi:hypothetical protein